MTNQLLYYQRILACSNRFIVLESPTYHSRKPYKLPGDTKRNQSAFGTNSYTDALQRAFNVVKTRVFFNPDMDRFITLTYKGKNHTPEQVLYDVKQLIKTEKRNHSKTLKYIYIMEYQKRGSIHVHMIANSNFTFRKNRNNYDELTHWKHGFSSALKITDFDANFRPYLYLFKYMKKSERIGKSFTHSSRNLDNYKVITDNDKINLNEMELLTQEKTQAILPNEHILNFTRSYYAKSTKKQPKKH